MTIITKENIGNVEKLYQYKK